MKTTKLSVELQVTHDLTKEELEVAQAAAADAAARSLLMASGGDGRQITRAAPAE